jgi:gamma-glutamyltranspeptidase / glutathione hydrolase
MARAEQGRHQLLRLRLRLRRLVMATAGVLFLPVPLLAPGRAQVLPIRAAVPAAAELAPSNVLQEAGQRFHPVVSAGGMVATQEEHASRVGRDVLRQGGNAVDAAVAASFALAVTLPQAGNLGGGGFLVLWPGTGGEHAAAGGGAAGGPWPGGHDQLPRNRARCRPRRPFS